MLKELKLNQSVYNICWFIGRYINVVSGSDVDIYRDNHQLFKYSLFKFIDWVSSDLEIEFYIKYSDYLYDEKET